jgi:hypothetical protein
MRFNVARVPGGVAQRPSQLIYRRVKAIIEVDKG